MRNKGFRIKIFVETILVIVYEIFTKKNKVDCTYLNLKSTLPRDIRSLACNKSYVLSVVAFTCVTYCAGAMMWWGPNFAYAGEKKFISTICTS